jgi:alpha-L-fucosidase
VIFSDGEWELSDTAWRSPELLAWLYNESPVAKEVVVNDRWGRNTRGRNTASTYTTSEYGSGMEANVIWEESQGIGHSYGYNRNEDLADYATGRRLLLTLLDTVSRGGNLLLNIGPTADGRIPVEMQERLAYLGNWLKYNGEAVYGTRTFREGAQWSAGRRQEVDTSTNYRAKYDVEKLTLAPEPGDARKEILFTRKGAALYAITPVRPRGDLTLRGVRAAPGARVRLLGSPRGELRWRQRGADLVVSVPPLEDLPFEGAYVFKLDGIAGEE